MGLVGPLWVTLGDEGTVGVEDFPLNSCLLNKQQDNFKMTELEKETKANRKKEGSE